MTLDFKDIMGIAKRFYFLRGNIEYWHLLYVIDVLKMSFLFTEMWMRTVEREMVLCDVILYCYLN